MLSTSSIALYSSLLVLRVLQTLLVHFLLAGEFTVRNAAILRRGGAGGQGTPPYKSEKIKVEV